VAAIGPVSQNGLFLTPKQMQMPMLAGAMLGALGGGLSRRQKRHMIVRASHEPKPQGSAGPGRAARLVIDPASADQVRRAVDQGAGAK